jgi:hypothetical protein
MPTYNEPDIAAAKAAWRKQDIKTWGKLDADSVSTRHDALIDLLCAHVPIKSNESFDV